MTSLEATRRLLFIFVALGVAQECSVAEEARRRPVLERRDEPLPPGHNVLKLYESRNVSAARKALARFVREQVNAASQIEGHNAVDLEAKLGVGVVANLVAHCFDLEQRYGARGPVPAELVQASQEVILAIDAALKSVGGATRVNERVRQVMEYAQNQKAALIVKRIVALRNAGDQDRARATADQYDHFLRSRGIPISEILPDAAVTRETRPPRPDSAAQQKPKISEEEAVSGRALAICQLLLDYYRALAAEDSDALDQCILKTPRSLTGREIVRRIAEEREGERDFDAIGPVRFDAKTRLTITPQGDGRYEVQCSGVLKSFQRGKSQFLQRESDRFLVKRVDNEYKLALERKGDRP